MNLASSFYTNVVEYKGKLLIRGVNNGQVVELEVEVKVEPIEITKPTKKAAAKK